MPVTGAGAALVLVAVMAMAVMAMAVARAITMAVTMTGFVVMPIGAIGAVAVGTVAIEIAVSLPVLSGLRI